MILEKCFVVPRGTNRVSDQHFRFLPRVVVRRRRGLQALVLNRGLWDLPVSGFMKPLGSRILGFRIPGTNKFSEVFFKRG